MGIYSVIKHLQQNKVKNKRPIFAFPGVQWYVYHEMKLSISNYLIVYLSAFYMGFWFNFISNMQIIFANLLII